MPIVWQCEIRLLSLLPAKLRSVYGDVPPDLEDVPAGHENLVETTAVGVFSMPVAICKEKKNVWQLLTPGKAKSFFVFCVLLLIY